jgi:16S rRNA processing protein RimM
LSKYLNIGIITNYHGLKGYVKVKPLTDNIKRFSDLEYIFINRNTIEKIKIEDVKYSKNVVMLKLKGIRDIDEAKKLKNLYIMIDKKDAIELPKDSYFICDLIDCEVYDEVEGYLGKVTDVLQTGSNDVYILKNDKGDERLIPALKEVVNKVDIESKRIEITLMEGL